MFVSRSVKYVVTSLLVITLVSLVSAMLTSLGFPYRADAARPTPQRLFVHVSCFSFNSYIIT